ncbi:MAG: hypothetical protein L0Y72_02370, partial [Gemmataceae bacterium]|nr:hypothetical protein [Gemmataceae bacterium]
RPMLFANSDNDSIFPMDGNRRIMEKLNKIYAMYGKPDLVDEYVSKGGHAYRPDLRVAIFQFINKHLKGDTTTPVEDSAKYKDLPGKNLRVFATDADLPKDALNARIDETFVPRAQVELPKEGKFADWKNKMIIRLRASCFLGFSQRIKKAQWVKEIAKFSTEENIFVFFGGVQVGPGLKSRRSLLLPNRSDDTERIERLAKPFLPDEDVFDFLRSRGSTLLAWTTKSPPNYVERAHALLGRTVDVGRTWDICAMVNYCASEVSPKSNWRLVGEGESGILAAYAALFEPSIKEVVVIDPPKSHKEGPHFLNVLRVLDIPEALGLLAPTPLTIIGGNDPAFDRTAEIYRLAGAADKLKRK